MSREVESENGPENNEETAEDEHASTQELTENVRQDAAVLVVGKLHGGVDPADVREFFRGTRTWPAGQV